MLLTVTQRLAQVKEKYFLQCSCAIVGSVQYQFAIYNDLAALRNHFIRRNCQPSCWPAVFSLIICLD